MDGGILQRILFLFLCFFQIYGEKFPGFVSIAIVDTFTGTSEKILLEPGTTCVGEDSRFQIKVKSIVADSENPSIGWIDLEISYKPSKADEPVCVQQGALSSNQIYRFTDERYILGFDISPYTDDGCCVQSDSIIKT